nr:hypothetical protein [Tanacetum cinerariifolium]
MNPQEKLQAVARDEKWVPSAERVKISSTNIRLETTVPQKEETFQVIIDVIKNSMCFKAFTISADVPKISNKKCIVNTKVFRSIFDICPRVDGLDFADVLDDDTALTFLIDLGYKGLLNRHTNFQTEAEEARKVHATHARIVTLSVSESAKKSSGRSSKSVIIQDTPSALNFKLATSKTKLKGASSLIPQEQEAADIMQAVKERTGAKPGVPDEDKDITEEKVILDKQDDDEQDSELFDEDNDDNENDDKDGDANDEGDDHVSDKQDDDDDKDDETEFDKDDIYKYKIRVRKDEDEEMKDDEVEGSDKGDEEITDATKEEAEKTSEAKDDTKKTKLPPSSSSLSVSSGFGDQFLKVSSDSSLVSTVKDSADADVSCLLDIPIQQKTPQIQVAKLEKDVSELKTGDHSSVDLVVLQSYVPIVVDSYLDTKVRDVFQKELQKHTANLIHKYSLQHLLELTKKSTPTTKQESEKKSALYKSMHSNKSFNRKHANHRLYHALIEALIEDENAIDKGVADTLKDHKRKHDDDEEDDDEDPLARPNQGKKTKRKRTKESKSLKKPSSTKETLKAKALTKGSKTGKSASAKEPVEEPIAKVIMKYAGDDLNNPEGDRYPFDLSKPLPLQGPPGHRTVATNYFFNNNLEYLKTFDLEVTYTTSIMKTKAAQYKIKGIKDMVPTLWSTIKHVYDKDASMGIKHRGKRRKLWYRSQGHLEEIVVKISDQQIYKFKEALRMFTRSLILKRRVEDLQLGVESYQRKVNITKPLKSFLGIKFKEPYTLSYDPPGIVYEDLNKQKRVLRADELYKFSDGTLTSVHDEIHHRVLEFRLDYNSEMPKRKWMVIDRKRSGLMIELIDKQLREREIIKNLERLVGARELEMDYKLMTRTV